MAYVLDSHGRPLHWRHEKLDIVDDRVAFIAGIGLTDYSGHRFDSRAVPGAMLPPATRQPPRGDFGILERYCGDCDEG